MSNRSFIGALSSLVSGTVLAQIIGVLSIPIIALLFSPTSFGEYSVAWLISTMVGGLISLRYERLISIVLKDEEARSASELAALVAIIVILILIACCFLFNTILSPLLGDQSIELVSFLYFLTLAILFGLYQLRTHWLIRRKEFKKIAIADACGAGAVLLFQAFFGFFGWDSSSALLLGASIGRAIQALLTFSKFPSLVVQSSYSRLLSLAVEHRKYPIYSTPYSIVSTAVSRALVIVGALFVSAETLGLISMAHRLAYLPVTTFVNALRRVYITRLSSQLNTEKFKQFSLVVFNFVTLLIIPYFIGVAVILPYLVRIILPEEWQGVENYAVILSIAAAPILLTGWFDRVYEVLNLQNISFIMETASTVLTVSIYWFLLKSGLEIEKSILVFSIIVGCYNIVWLLITWQLAGFSVRSFCMQIGRSLGGCTFVCFIIYTLTNLNLNLNWYQVLPITIVSAAVFIWLMFDSWRLLVKFKKNYDKNIISSDKTHFSDQTSNGAN